MSGRQFSPEKKLEVIEAVKAGCPVREVMAAYSLAKITISTWRKKYDKYGLNGLRRAKKHKTYPDTFKERVVREHLNAMTSMVELAHKYDIPSKETVRQWVIRYNKGEEMRTTREGASPLTKGRKTTYAERIEIAEYHAQEAISYRELAERFEVSYQQARNIVVKYKAYGKIGLADKRGKRKSNDQRTETERLHREISMLKADKRKLEVENALLKKLEELERN